MAEREQLYQALRNADAAGDTAAAQKLAAYIQSMPSDAAPRAPTYNDIPADAPRPGQPARERAGLPQLAAPEDNLLGKAFGAVEVPLTLASGAIGGLVGSLAGAGKTITSGKFGTQAGIREGDAFGGKVAEALTYQPRTQSGGAMVSKIGEAINDSGIMGVPIPELNALGRGARSSASAVRNMAEPSAAAMAAQEAVQRAGAGRLRDIALLPKKKPMAGGGAALTEEATLRLQRAASMPVPIKLTRGQASRTFKEQQFERETAKLPEGDPLRQRFASQNEQVVQNLDAFIDETGAMAADLRSVGRSVVDATASRKAMKKGEVNQAYAAAREAGDMAETIDMGALRKYIDDNRPASLNAPILNSVEKGLEKLDPHGSGMVSLNDLEELRKMTGRLAQPGTPNAVYAGDIKQMIDAATEGKGGPLYQQARRQYENYATEFKNRGVIDKMLRTKPGTKDRAVAFEDVLDHAVFKGPLDDVRHVRRTLQTAGPAGEQAWRELQGGTLNKIKKTILSNTARDQNGNSIVSPAKLDRLIENLDADGKLDFLYGKQGAQKIRDLNDLAKDVYTSPPGSVNHSNTSTALMAALDLSSSAFTGLPLPAATAINYGVKKFKSNSLKKKVSASLDAERATLPRRKP